MEGDPSGRLVDAASTATATVEVVAAGAVQGPVSVPPSVHSELFVSLGAL